MNKNKVRFYVNKKARQIFKSTVERNGTRAIDTGVFYCPKGVPITKGDDIAYVQDPVNTTYLTGIWNFFDNTRDESGHELDGAEDATYVTNATYGDSCNGRVIKFSGASKAVKIADRTATSTSLKLMDFSGQFDIMIWFSNNNTTANYNEGALFSKGISSNKIQIETIHDSGAQYVKAQIGSNSNIITGRNVNTLTEQTMNASGYHWVRLKRDGNNLVTLSVDGTSEGTATVAGDVAATTTDLYIGGDYQGSGIGRAYISQVRLYCGGFITDEEFTTLRGTYRQPNTIKFGGTVWKVDEKPTHKIAHCKGYAKTLHDTVITASTTDSSLTAGGGTGWTTSNGIYKNTYTDKDGLEIMTDLMKVYTGTGTDSVLVVAPQSNISGSTREYSEYKAVGTLYSNIVLLSINGRSDSSFSIDGRKVLRFEDEDIEYTHSDSSSFEPIAFHNGHIKIHDLGYDDSTLVTQVTGFTQIPKKKKTVVKDANQFEDYSANTKIMRLGYEYPIDIDITVTQNSGATPILTNVTGVSDPADNTEYKLVKDGSNINAVFGADASHANDEFTAVYFHEDIYGESGRKHYYNYQGSNAASLGVFAKTLYLPQLTNAYKSGANMDLLQFLSRYIARFQNFNRRFKIIIPSLANHIRENYNVRIVDTFHGVAHDANTPDNDHNAMVKSIKYHYPEGITEVICGEHFLDSFDLNNAFGTALHELRSTISETEKTAA